MLSLDYLLIYNNTQQIIDLKIDHSKIKTLNKRGIIVTAAKGQGLDKYDCVSRCFYPTLLNFKPYLKQTFFRRFFK